jgi:hypothetical protein|tara:strand:- start:65815 stop:67641 length:1827 start_codon:yes stop_codon:yes gene_type:complete
VRPRLKARLAQLAASRKHIAGLAALTAIVLATPIQAQIWQITDWDPACIADNGASCDLGDHGVAVVLEQLQDVSQKLKDMGFRSPHVQRSPPLDPNSPYIVHLQEEPITIEGTGRAGNYSLSDGKLSIAYGLFFALGTETDQYMGTAAHELFHAVQASYGNRQLFVSRESDWISEGMAEAIALALAGAGTGISSTGTPYLDYSLDNLASVTGDPDDGKYASYPFWLYLAKRYGGAPDSRYAIFHDFLVEAENHLNLGRSVAIADAALRTIDPDGLYDIYPAFTAEVGNHPGFFEDVIEVKPVPDQTATASVETEATVRPLAARAFSVDIPASVATDGNGSRAVEIRLETEDPDAFHLIVGDKRYDEVSGADRNVYFETGEDLDSELFVRVANVSRDAAASREQNFKLVVTVYQEFVEMRSDGAQSGDAGIDAPLSISARALGQFWGPMRLRLILEAGLDDPCMFQLDMIATDRRASLGMMLLQNGPMPPGDYPIAGPEPRETVGQQAHAQEYAGQVVATFILDEGHPLIGEYAMRYMGQAGVVTIELITPHWIVGHARIAGTWTTTRPTTLPYDAPPAGPRDLEIEVAFSVPNAAVASRVNVASCIGT